MRNKIQLTTISIYTLLLLGCFSFVTHSFSGDYLGYDESKEFRAQYDEGYGFNRPKYLMKYSSMSKVESVDRGKFERLKKDVILPATKGEWFYFSTSFEYEEYIWAPDPDNPNMITTTDRLWVYGLNRYRIEKAIIETEKQPNNKRGRQR